MTKRAEFPASVKKLARERAGHVCEMPGCENSAFEVDHVIECWEGGTNTLDNAQVLCSACHKEKTAHSTHLRFKGKRFAVRKGRKRSGKIKSRGFQKGVKAKWPRRKIQTRKGIK